MHHDAESTALPHPQQDRVLILVNPRAGPSGAIQRVEPLRERLAAKGLSVEISTDLAAVTAQADALHAAGSLRALVGVGGDGTAAELVNRTAPGVPITLLAAGSANLLARHLGLSREPHALAQVILDGHCLQLDAARANARLFLLMASAGFDADVVQRLHAKRRGHIRGWPTYVAHMLESIRGYHFPEIRVQSQQGEFPARWCFAFNIPRYAGNFQFLPEADATDGQLDVCLYDWGGFWPGLQFAAAVKLGVQRRLAQWRDFRTVRVRLDSVDRVPYQLDGDPGGHLPVDLEILPGRLCLVAPRPAGPIGVGESAVAQ